MLALALGACLLSQDVATTGPRTSGTVTWVYDGDTVAVDNGRFEIDVRLVGINAPESGECLAEAAADHLERTVRNRTVTVEARGADQFGRTLAVIWDGERNANREMVQLGLAIATTPAEPGFLTAESNAISAGLGLWAANSCSSGPMPMVVIVKGSSIVDPPGPDNEGIEAESITIRNEGSESVDIGGWVLRDESSLHRLTFAAGARIEPGDSLTITSADSAWDPGVSPVWNNDGDIVMLLDDHGRVIDHWRYDRSEG